MKRPTSLSPVRSAICALALLTLALAAGCSRSARQPDLRAGDAVLRAEGARLEVLQLVARGDGLEAINAFAAEVPSLEYKCDHDPPQSGDNCTCGGTGNFPNDFADCMSLLGNCAPGTYNDDPAPGTGASCTHKDVPTSGG